MGVTYYKSGRISMMRTLPQLIKAQTVASVRRATRALRNEIHAEYIKRGIGRALYEGRGTRILGGSQLKTIIKAATTRHRGDVIETAVYVKGTAALVATGGKTKEHDIKPSLDKFRTSSRQSQYHLIAHKAYTGGNAYADLKGVMSSGKGGKFIAAGTVRHPGSRFKKDGFMDRGAARGLPRFKEEVTKGMAKVAEVVNRAA